MNILACVFTFILVLTPSPEYPTPADSVPSTRHGRILDGSVSTPNLSATSHGKQPSQQSTKSTPPVSGVDRWLSPETWCDALFFPRPCLRSERAHGQYGGSSGRIISPPITPVAEGASPRLSPAIRGRRPQVLSATHDVRKEHHVLLKSRSAVDILSGPSISGRPRTASTPQQRPDPDPDPVRNTSPKEDESVPGPSTVQQELRPSASVPSLTQVLEEGEVLEAQRKRWQHQASHSFGNSRTRSLSRTRARSLSRSHSRPGHKQEGSTTLEYLAACTLLGAQSIAPTVNAARSSHSRSHSHSHSQTHSNSRGRSSSYSFTGSQSHSLALGPATEETNIIHLSDPAGGSHNVAGEESVIIIGISPAPTTASGEGVGIALSSPPPVDDRSSHDPELTSMPNHPYATGAIYTRYTTSIISTFSPRRLALPSNGHFHPPPPACPRLERQRKLAEVLHTQAEAEDRGEDVERQKNWEWTIEENEARKARRADYEFHGRGFCRRCSRGSTALQELSATAFPTKHLQHPTPPPRSPRDPRPFAVFLRHGWLT
ncbi:hypothetical protein DEU56DRAFT_956907 [Suillus clintonianus]|uniref:uncharacterized protein n=1 Tax=Suillus clintonianus TaxID=1904413 RepID=UPI001B863391|nr:uncharacterized protein DEU56DRAFT_956907 [Suillus clintonianus]KAG2128965.1 hypothetical protein DEU56DRAFT_956907 [Suillus clintonianus]